MPTGYDLLEHSHEFRMHTLKRAAACLLDLLLIFLPTTLCIFFLQLEPEELLIGVFSGFLWFVYSVVFESIMGTTLGKKIVGLVIVSTDGPMTLSKGIVRNIPKMFWYLFLPIDYFVGLGISDDPRQRWVDTIGKTVVVSDK